MNVKFTGKIIAAGQVQMGTSQNGTQWSSQEYVIEPAVPFKSRYPSLRFRQDSAVRHSGRRNHHRQHRIEGASVKRRTLVQSVGLLEGGTTKCPAAGTDGTESDRSGYSAASSQLPTSASTYPAAGAAVSPSG